MAGCVPAPVRVFQALMAGHWRTRDGNTSANRFATRTPGTVAVATRPLTQRVVREVVSFVSLALGRWWGPTVLNLRNKQLTGLPDRSPGRC